MIRTMKLKENKSRKKLKADSQKDDFLVILPFGNCNFYKFDSIKSF